MPQNVIAEHPCRRAAERCRFAGVHNDVAGGIYECARMGVTRIFVAPRSGWRRRRRDADVESNSCDESLERQTTFGGTVPHAARPNHTGVSPP